MVIIIPVPEGINTSYIAPCAQVGRLGRAETHSCMSGCLGLHILVPGIVENCS